MVLDKSELQSSKNNSSVFELTKILLQHKLILLIFIVSAAITSITYALMLPNMYQSEVLLSPVSSEKNGGLASLAGQLGGLASIAGINLSDDSSNKIVEAMEIIKSRKFVSDFLNYRGITPKLMATKGWDSNEEKLIYNLSIYNPVNDSWLLNDLGKSMEPLEQDKFEAFKNTFKFKRNKETGFINITAEHFSPIKSKTWLEWLIIDINNEMRKRDKIESEKSLSYLNKKIQKTDNSEYRNLLYQLTEEQEKSLMFINSRDEYVLKVIDPPFLPEVKVSPKRAVIVILGTFLGGIFGLLFIIVRVNFYEK